MKTAYSYIRFSTPDQAMGDSERRQLALAQTWCDRNNYRLSEDTFADRGRSAFHGKHRREGKLKNLLAIVKPGDVVLVENIDRWSREDPLDSNLERRKVVYSGTNFFFLQEGVMVTKENFSTPQVRYLLFFGADRANGESERKKQLIKADWDKKKAALAAGQTVNTNRKPCWLEWDEETDKPVVIPTKARTIKRMFELAMAGNLVVDITRKLRGTQPITTSKKNRAWNPTTVRRILTDKAVCGYYTQAEPPTPGVWPAIIDEKTFATIQSKLEVAPRQNQPFKSEANLFTSLVKCARCGQHLNAHTSSKEGQKARLVCSGATNGRSDCTHAGAPLELIEKSILSFLAENDSIRTLLAAKSDKPSKLEELQAQLTQTQKIIAKVENLIFGVAEAPDGIMQRLMGEQAKAKQLAIAIEAEQMRIKGETPALQSYLDFCNRLPSLGKDKAKRPELRRAIASVVESITLDPRGKNGVWWSSLQLKGSPRRFEIASGLAAHLRRMGN